MIIWFATGNMNKKAELQAILGDVNLEIKTPNEAGLLFDPDESGTSFHENAMIKALELYRLLCKKGLFNPGDAVIADDSGLCVDALDGRPGIYSARYAGADRPPTDTKLTSAERNALLLEELGNKTNRKARFVCAMVLLWDENRFYLVSETIEGEIVKGLSGQRGDGGFGYDPVFYIPELGKTAAELPDAEKNKISHRGKAARVIGKMLGSREQGAD